MPEDLNDDGWTEVKPRQLQKVERERSQRTESPATPSPRDRADSSNDLNVQEKGRISRYAHRENKLEWSASKARERNARIEKRSAQRERVARENAEARK